MAFKLNHQKESPLQQRLQSSSGGTSPEVEAMNKMLAERALASGIQPSKPDIALDANELKNDFKSDSLVKQASTLISNPFQGLKALGNQTSYNYVDGKFGTNNRDSGFDSLTSLREAKENRGYGEMHGDVMNSAGQIGLFAASGGLKAIQGLFKAPAAIKAATTAATTAAKSGKALTFAKSLTNPLTTQTYLDAASGDLTALAAKYLPKAFRGKAKDLLGKGYYAYKGGKIQGVGDLVKSGTKGAIDLGKAVANSVTPETSKTGLANAYAQMGQGMQEKATKERAIDEATKKDAVAETNKDNLIMRGS